MKETGREIQKSEARPWDARGSKNWLDPGQRRVEDDEKRVNKVNEGEIGEGRAVGGAKGEENGGSGTRVETQ